jgi:hypothetical protein
MNTDNPNGVNVNDLQIIDVSGNIFAHEVDAELYKVYDKVTIDQNQNIYANNLNFKLANINGVKFVDSL